jgi:cob(I)alamin adenosyltransferase
MNRRIYTRTGDGGKTSLVDGTRVPKESVRIEAYGSVDEANSWVGAARSLIGDRLLDQILEFVQHRLYNCSSSLATLPESNIEPAVVSAADVDYLEKAIDQLEDRSGKIMGFVLPGGTQAASAIHVARTVCRRAERRIWELTRTEEVDEQVLKFINRASDLLFAAARYANALESDGDVLWDKVLPIPKD